MEVVRLLLIVGLVTLGISVIGLFSIDSPVPIIGSLVIVMLISEIFFYHYIGKKRQDNHL
ncbi:hypothetical protein [Halobacillus sp. BBL2006]|uniref:hypothetical protein n=1 Tax=Halobacillus sp. BBL2006 TaxID=1543706 RepID=UPI00054375DA|nr:hypothetical protein [Halobacillus sp. BBL2006]KHE72447.1 hypothetical protein LD39_04505 [Halobacillus sp. BBL2006]